MVELFFEGNYLARDFLDVLSAIKSKPINVRIRILIEIFFEFSWLFVNIEDIYYRNCITFYDRRLINSNIRPVLMDYSLLEEYISQCVEYNESFARDIVANIFKMTFNAPSFEMLLRIARRVDFRRELLDINRAVNLLLNMFFF